MDHPVIILIPFFLALFGDLLRLKAFETFDNHNPRQQTLELSGLGTRVWSAQQNAWEALAMYVPSVLVAHIVGADPQQSTYAAIVFCAARVVHASCYIFNFATLRSLSYFIALGCCVRLFWLAAQVQ